MRSLPLPGTRLAAGVAVVVLAALPAALPPAGAHESGSGVVAVLDAIEPAEPPGVRIAVEASVTQQLVVANPTSVELEVLAEAGEPFLRISSGRVLANVASPDWPASNSPFVTERGSPDRPGRPRWVLVSRQSSWGWFDHRLHPRELEVTPDVRAARRPVRLGDWQVPMRYGGRPLTVRGHVEFRPVRGRVRTDLSSPAAEGVEAAILTGRVPALFVRVLDDSELTILGSFGEPYARIGPSGAEVNERSQVHHEDQRARGLRPAAPVDPRAPPRWRRVADSGQLSWFDPRLRYLWQMPPDDVLDRSAPTELTHWTVPYLHRGQRRELAGTIVWAPVESEAGAAPPPTAAANRSGNGRRGLLAAAVLLTAGSAGGWLLRRRNRQTALARRTVSRTSPP